MVFRNSGALDREVISLFSVFIGMLRPIVGVAVGSAGNSKLVCRVTKQGVELRGVLVTLAIYFGGQRK